MSDATQGDATFSKDSKRRLHLWRRWDFGPRALWICLNPSTAGKRAEDPSTRKIRGFTERMKCGSYDLYNLFDWCATDPSELRGMTLEELSSPSNLAGIMAAARHASVVVCAWGNHGRMHGQAARMLAMLRGAQLGRKMKALHVNGNGTPAHPLMLPYDLKPIPYTQEPA